MKIIYIADGGETYDMSRFYLTQRRLLGGFIRNGHNAILFSVKFMRKHLGWLPSRWVGTQAVNAKLIDFARNFRPDLMVLHHAHAIQPETLAELRRLLPALRIGQISVDALFAPGNVGRLLHKIDQVDATFVTTGGPVLRQFARKGAVAGFMPNPVDPSIDIHRSFAADDQRWELFLALTGAEGDDRRRTLPEAIKQAIPDLRFAYYSHAAGQNLWGTDYVDTLGATRMGLNLSYTEKGAGAVPAEALHMYSSSRIAQYVGNGLLLLLRAGHGLEALFTAEEAAFYEEADDLIDRIRFFRADDAARRRIAERGWRRAHDSYNERQVAQYIVDVTTGRPLSMQYGWDTTLYR